MPTYKLTIEYDGTRFRGWQTHLRPDVSQGVGGQNQRNTRGIQGELVKAATELLSSPVDIQGSGRTDAGVHALAQVAHLTTKKSLPPSISSMD